MLGSLHASGERLDVCKDRKRETSEERQIEGDTGQIIWFGRGIFCIIMIFGSFTFKPRLKP